MKEYIFTELGYFTETTMKKLKRIMDGKTFMKFEVSWSNFEGNCTLIIKTNYVESEENVKGLFLACALELLVGKEE